MEGEQKPEWEDMDWGEDDPNEELNDLMESQGIDPLRTTGLVAEAEEA